MQGGHDALGRRSQVIVQQALGQKARAVQRDLAFQASGGVIANEFGGTATREETSHGIGFDGSDFSEQGLEFHVREGQAKFFDDGAACGQIAFFETLTSFVTGGVFPGDPDCFFMAFGHHRLAQGQRGLAVGERSAEHVGCAQGTGGGMHPRIGNDVEHTGFPGDFVDAHLHARVDCAYQHIHLVALHQLVGVFNTLGRL